MQVYCGCFHLNNIIPELEIAGFVTNVFGDVRLERGLLRSRFWGFYYTLKTIFIISIQYLLLEIYDKQYPLQECIRNACFIVSSEKNKTVKMENILNIYFAMDNIKAN